MIPPPALSWRTLRVRRDGKVVTDRAIPEETAVAFTYGRASYAVMMATPADLEDFALGFSLNEAVIERPSQLCSLEIVQQEHGLELRMELSEACDAALLKRRRSMAGPAGCGLCGIESLSGAVRPPPHVTSPIRVPARHVFAAMDGLRAGQTLNAQTRAVHGAGLWSTEREQLTLVREDVGRHNALDKLCGALARSEITHDRAMIVMTSRISIELVQKAATLGAGILAAVSVPTAYAVRAAAEANLTLVAVARDDSFEIFTHSDRILA